MTDDVYEYIHEEAAIPMKRYIMMLSIFLYGLLVYYILRQFGVDWSISSFVTFTITIGLMVYVMCYKGDKE